MLQENMCFYDHIGFRRDDAGECSLDLILQNINSFQDSLVLDKVVIIGHSIHAYMAVEYAKKFPDRVDKIILIGSGPYSDFKAADSYFEEFASADRKDALQNNLNLPPGYFSADPFIDRMLRFAPMLWYDYNYDGKSLWEGVKFNHRAANIIWGDMFKDYKIEEFTHPSVIMIGMYDFFNPPHLWVNKSNLILFERSGHTPQIEERDKFDREFLRFLYEKV
jgi:proline iminopeptidase